MTTWRQFQLCRSMSDQVKTIQWVTEYQKTSWTLLCFSPSSTTFSSFPVCSSFPCYSHYSSSSAPHLSVSGAQSIKSCSKTNNNKRAQSSYLCCVSLGLSICQSVCFALRRQTMIPSSTAFIPQYETSERLQRRNCEDTMDFSRKVQGDGFGWESLWDDNGKEKK